MKKPVLLMCILIFIMLCIICCPSDLYSNDDLTFDLIAGSFNGKQIGSSIIPKDVIEIMGKQPEDTDFDIYSYYEDGLEFSFSKIAGIPYCNQIMISLQTHSSDDYKSFNGRVNPLKKTENQQNILKIFKGY